MSKEGYVHRPRRTEVEPVCDNASRLAHATFQQRKSAAYARQARNHTVLWDMTQRVSHKQDAIHYQGCAAYSAQLARALAGI